MPKAKILIVAASTLEIRFLLQNNFEQRSENLYSIYSYNVDIDLLITGVGATAMTYFLTTQLQKEEYNFALLVGIAGSYYKSIKIGDVVNVESERFADLGIVNTDSFTDLFDMKLAEENSFPFENRILKNYTLINNSAINQLPNVKGNTVQSIRPEVLHHIQKDTDIESMEGASFAFVCAQKPVPYAHLRSISNIVGQQDKNLWNIPLAIENMERVLKKVLSDLG